MGEGYMRAGARPLSDGLLAFHTLTDMLTICKGVLHSISASSALSCSTAMHGC